METKICKTKRQFVISCGLEKPKSEFYERSSLCKECSKQLNNLKKEYHKNYRKKYYQNNSEKQKLLSKKYRVENKEYFVEYRKNNRVKLNQKAKENYLQNT